MTKVILFRKVPLKIYFSYPPQHLRLDVSAGNSGDMFVWMSKEHLCVLVYVVTVMHSMQAGYMDKAQKYTEKAFLQIEKLKR